MSQSKICREEKLKEFEKSSTNFLEKFSAKSVSMLKKTFEKLKRDIQLNLKNLKNSTMIITMKEKSIVIIGFSEKNGMNGCPA